MQPSPSYKAPARLTSTAVTLLCRLLSEGGAACSLRAGKEGGKYGESADFCLNQVKGCFQSQDNNLHVYQLP